ncbi:MAG: hypothetical protein ACO1N2_02575 [Candidatus Saccharimonadota bacterium]
MDFDETRPVGKMRSTRKVDQTMREQDPVYEFRLACAEEFEGLPYRAELDDAMAEFAHSQKIHYVQEVPVVLEPGDLPTALNDAFYFPDSPTIEAMTLDVQKDADGNQYTEGSFYVGRMPFKVEPGFPGLKITTESHDGSELSYVTSQETLFELLGVMYARNAARMLEQLHKESKQLSQEKDSDIEDIPFAKITSGDVRNVSRQLIGGGEWLNVKDIFEKLANETGKTQFTTYSIFSPDTALDPSVSDERALLATKTETIHGSIEQTDITLDINWFFGEKNTEIIGTTTHNSGDKFTPPAPSAVIQPVDYDLESFAFMKELQKITGGKPDGRLYSPDDPEWLMLVSIFMTTVRPHLQKHAENYSF